MAMKGFSFLDCYIQRTIFISLTLLIFLIERTLQYNLETRIPVIKNGPGDSYFGFSVAEHIIQSRTPRAPAFAGSLFLVGAPILENEELPYNRTGGVFKCPLTSFFDDCEVVDIENDAYDRNKDKNGEWLGVTVRSQGPGGTVAACAHRYKEIDFDGDNINSISPMGKVFLMESNLEFSDQNRDGWVICEGQGAGFTKFGYCQAGTGLGITRYDPPLHDFPTEYAFGGPGAGDWRGSMTVTNTEFGIWRSKITDESVGVERNSYFGFSIASGQFAPGRILFLGGAPRANATGAVIIMDKSPSKSLNMIDMIISTMAYSSFGYDVAAADLNGDQCDDIIVGAPMYFDRNTQAGGAVYIYINEQCNGMFSGVEPIILTGPRDSRFGMSVASMRDTNNDGFEDFAVGAPYENDGQGAVYIYLGSGTDGVSQPAAQKIMPSDFPMNLQGAVLPNRTFGYSLSGGLDLDGNSFSDLLVGAFEMESVVLLRGRPVINLTATVSVDPSQLDPDVGTCNVSGELKLCFTITICALYTSNSDFDEELLMLYDLEAESKRISLGLNSRVYFKNADVGHILANQELRLMYKTDEQLACTGPIEAILRDDYTDIYRSIPLKVTFKLPEQEPEIPVPGEPLPDMKMFAMFDKDVATSLSTECDPESDTFSTCVPIPGVKVEFTKECAIDDGVCITDLVIGAEFDLPDISERGNPLMKVGIDSDLRLSVTIDNREEHAYDAKLVVDFPSSLSYSGLEEGATERVRFSCGDPEMKEGANDTMTVTCILGNPYPPVPAKDAMVMRFDGIGIPSDIGSFEVALNAVMTNDDSNPADNRVTILVDVESITDIQLDGVASKSQYMYGGIIRGESGIEKENQIGPLVTQKWTVFNQGPAKVSAVKVTINFPFEVTNGKWLLYMLEKPMVEKGTGECYIDDGLINVADIQPCPNCTERSVAHRGMSYDPDDYSTPDQIEVGAEVVLDCQNGTANCFNFTCTITDLSAEQNENEATILVKARLWNATFMEDYLPAKKVIVRAHGYVELDENEAAIQTNIQNDRDTINFEVIGPKLVAAEANLPWWIILLAIFLGLFVLVILILVLWKFGFFERKSGYQYATVTQKQSETKVGTEKTQMYDEMYYARRQTGDTPHQL